MANREEVIRLAFEADLSDMRKELAKLPEISSKEAKKMVSSLEKQYKRAEKAAKKTAKAQKDSAAKVSAGFESAKQAAEGFGGAIGGSAGQIEKFARSAFEASKALGPVGVGALAAGLAIVGVGAAAFAAGSFIVGMIADAEELIDTLEPFTDGDIFAPVPAETQASIESFNDTMSGLSAIASRLKLEIGGDLANAYAGSAEAVLVATFAVADFVEHMGGLGAVVETVVHGPFVGLARALKSTEGATVAGALEWAGYGEELESWRKSAKDTIDVAREEKEKVDEERKATERAAAAKKAAAAAERAYQMAVRGALKAIKEQQSAQDKLAKITTTANADLLTDEDKINQAHADRIEAIAEIALAAKDAGAVQEAIASADERRIRELQTLETERAENEKQLLREINELDMQMREAMKARAVAAVAQTLADIGLVASAIGGTIGTLGDLRINMIEETFNANAAAIEKEGEKRRAMKEENIASLLEAGKIDQAEADKRLEHIDELEKADKKKIKKLEKLSEAAALKSFKGQKAAQKAQAVIDGARSALALVPAFAFLGPGAPAAAAAVATTATATQLAVISAQKPPDFPTGGLVADRLPGGAAANGDHFAISAQASEGIVTGRGMDALGRDGLDAINTQGGGGGNTFILKLNEQVIARAILGVPGLARQIVGELQAEMRITAGRVAVYGSG
jgi:hypothetical protein